MHSSSGCQKQALIFFPPVPRVSFLAEEIIGKTRKQRVARGKMLATPEIALAWQIPVCYERAMSRNFWRKDCCSEASPCSYITHPRDLRFKLFCALN